MRFRLSVPCIFPVGASCSFPASALLMREILQSTLQKSNHALSVRGKASLDHHANRYLS